MTISPTIAMVSESIAVESGVPFASGRACYATPSIQPLLQLQIFRRASYGDRNLFAASQAGLVNNLNDGMSWGIFALFLAVSASAFSASAS
jgi:hypothetical protein